DPARTRIVLRELRVCAADHVAVFVQHQACAAGRALVDGEDARHVRSQRSVYGARCTPVSSTIALMSDDGVTSNAGANTSQSAGAVAAPKPQRTSSASRCSMTT